MDDRPRYMVESLLRLQEALALHSSCIHQRLVESKARPCDPSLCLKPTHMQGAHGWLCLKHYDWIPHRYVSGIPSFDEQTASHVLVQDTKAIARGHRDVVRHGRMSITFLQPVTIQ